MMKFFREFKEFIERGNVMDLAVAFVMGAAFTAIVTALVADFITPLLALFIPSGTLDALAVPIGHSKITYGHFIGAVINFLAIALVVFLIVLGLNKLMRKKPANTKECPFCGSTIPDTAVRCPNCTTLLDPSKVPFELR
jgi:large conductance mechanosensitive channel